MELTFNNFSTVILHENDAKNTEDVIVINAINSFFIQKNFKYLLGNLSIKIGPCGDDGYVSFTFWDNLDDYDRMQYEGEPFDGVEVEFMGDIKVFDLQDVFYFMDLASQRYIALYPAEREEIGGLLNNMKITFNLE